MLNITTYEKNAIINARLRTNPVYLALFIGNPSSGGVEVSTSGTGYVRQAITFAVPVDGYTNNSVTVEFPTATADYGDVNYIAIYDASSGGNRLYEDDCATKTVYSGNNAYFPVGKIEYTIA
jgi:hypothetical protein